MNTISADTSTVSSLAMLNSTSKQRQEPRSELSASSYETEHVHAVYDQIAGHFSQTRYKPWPIVSSFLKSLPPGSVGLDVGCGNGKYLCENANVFIIGSDMSERLLQLARDATTGKVAAENGNIMPATDGNPEALSQSPSISSLVIASTLSLPHPRTRFDFAISIAVVHHLSTRDRRIHAVREILGCLKPEGKSSGDPAPAAPAAGKALLYVWALEQKSSRRGWGEGDEQDVMVPWVLKNENASKSKTKREQKQKNKGSTVDSIASDTTTTDDGGLHRDLKDTPKVYQRYYHLYRKGELEEDVISAGGQVLECGYEKDNWWWASCAAARILHYLVDEMMDTDPANRFDPTDNFLEYIRTFTRKDPNIAKKYFPKAPCPPICPALPIGNYAGTFYNKGYRDISFKVVQSDDAQGSYLEGKADHRSNVVIIQLFHVSDEYWVGYKLRGQVKVLGQGIEELRALSRIGANGEVEAWGIIIEGALIRDDWRDALIWFDKIPHAGSV